MSNKEIVFDALNKIFESKDRISTADFYEVVKETLEPKVELAEFRILFSKLLSSGEISGFESVRGRFGGIKKMGEAAHVSVKSSSEEDDDSVNSDSGDEDESELETTKKVTINISPSIRIYNTDSRNWTIQSRTGDIWLSKFYYPTLNETLKGLAKKMLNKEIKSSSAEIHKLNDLSGLIEKAEQNVAILLKNLLSPQE